ncbi:MAG: hypothetical protein JO327_11820 [Nitrososphaeraceae archaeon]|nr:hypothetical protein [Nitrososphaeraceae archaeon]MBV9668802.1 hypothetical protein [Nitrososphaeraceae archaeon]
MENCPFDSETFNLIPENQEQYSARVRIKGEATIPVTGPPGTGKSTFISRCCFDLLKEYSPVLVVTPTNAMVDYLWRVHIAIPAKSQIAIFNRSHYEDVIEAQVHNLILDGNTMMFLLI